MTRALADAQNAIIGLQQYDADAANATLQQQDLETVNKNIIATDTLVGLFGMHVCNYGH